jgi:hypothetical protein
MNDEVKMTTQKQIDANRTNAKLSTGPKTDEGRAVVGTNALKHGIFSRHVILDGESKKDFDSLKQEFYNQFQPQGLLENLFWERALTAAWRLSRVTQMESMLINHAADRSCGSGIIEVLGGYAGDELALLSRYEISLEKILFRSLGELRVLQNARQSNQPISTLEIGFDPQNLSHDVSEAK